MIHRDQLTQYVHNLLNADAIPDYTINGLQVQGVENITKIVSGGTACQALLDQAVEQQADAVLVHHGYFWRNEPQAITGPKKQRLQTLLRHNINVWAYHLPLDLHEHYGNNALLGQRMGWIAEKTVNVANNLPLVQIGRLLEALSLDQLQIQCQTHLNSQPLAIAGGAHDIWRVAWCTGAGEDFIEQAAQTGVDAYITGEASERTAHLARERGIHFIAAGHHATERDGVCALGNHLAMTFNLRHQFIDIPNPV